MKWVFYWFLKWQNLKAFDSLFIICGEYDQDSQEYTEIVTVLDILRKRIHPIS